MNDEDIKIEGVIPFDPTSKAPEDTSWDGPAEVAKADVSDLKIMCAWYDSANPDIKGSYKLPHHLADSHNVVWKGVAAAMAVVLGARGGVDVPEADKKGIYNHLAKHYKQFDKEVPEYKQYTPEELESLGLIEKKELEATIESMDLGSGEIEAVVATNAIDRHGEKIDISGMNTKAYMKNPVVQWAHDYEKPPIGKTTKIWKDENSLMARMKFAVAENPFAKTIYDLVKGGFLNAVSIGFIPMEMDGNTYTKSEMVEFSIVPVPANADALISARKLGIDTDFLQDYNLEEMKTKGDEKPVEEKPVETPVEEKPVETPVEEKPEEKPEDEVQEQLKKLQKDVEALKDPVKVKDIHISKVGDKEVSKEMKLLYFLQGVKSGNFKRYLDVVGKEAMNTTDDADVLPPQEFVSEIIRLEEQYGVARRFASVRASSNGAGIRFLLGADDVEIFDTAENSAKKSTKLSYDQQTLAWRKFAAILPISDELTEDSALDLWNDATQRFARAFSKKEDELVFTNVAAGGVTKDGIVEVSGTFPVTVDDVDSIEFEDLVDMTLGVPSMSGNTGSFFLNRTMLAPVMKLKDNYGRPLWLPGVASGMPATILGRPYVETEVLPTTTEAGAGDALIVYGDLKYATLAERSALKVEMFNTGIVGDPDEEDQDTNTVNLLTQDVQAMRCVKRMNAIVRFPAAFSVMKITGGS